MLYVTTTGGGWAWLPHDVPTWKTVYHYVRLWYLTGMWEAMHAALRAWVRQALGRNEQPSATIIDRPSVKTTCVSGPERGSDGGKNVHRRKRHLVVDTHGFVVARKVHAATMAARDSASLVLSGVGEPFPQIETLWTDSGYNGRFRP